MHLQGTFCAQSTDFALHPYFSEGPIFFALLCIAACSLLVHILSRVQSAGISRWSAAFPCSDLRIVLAMARFSERHHSAWVSKTICDICDQFCFDFGLKLPQNLWNVFVFVSASVLLKTRYQAWRERQKPEKAENWYFPNGQTECHATRSRFRSFKAPDL